MQNFAELPERIMHSVTFRRKNERFLASFLIGTFGNAKTVYVSRAAVHFQGVVLGPENHTKNRLYAQLSLVRLFLSAEGRRSGSFCNKFTFCLDVLCGPLKHKEVMLLRGAGHRLLTVYLQVH